jgi:CRISPR/Cas system CSM-associated protein Csm3 (group 7 of RAMP superfamily)
MQRKGRGIVKKIYYRLEITQCAPLRIGNGENEETDSDLMLDSRGLPFIPGTSLAGVLRDRAAKLFDEETVKKVFGYIDKNDGSNKVSSRLVVNDACLEDDAKVYISIRDGVGLDEWGMAKDGAKYDFQVVETDEKYAAILELTSDENSELIGVIEALLFDVERRGISLGARTTRGYGQMKVSVRKKEFDFSDTAAVFDEWLEFDVFSKSGFDDAIELVGADVAVNDIKKTYIDVKIKVNGSFAVRVNTSRVGDKDDVAIPDSVPLMTFGDNPKPVISGTAWAGAFLHHMKRIVRESRMKDTKKIYSGIDKLFGREKVDGETVNIRSGIVFAETAIDGGAELLVTRNAVDRFTAAPRNAALFTSKVWQGGTGNLKITLEGEVNQTLKKLFSVALYDLDAGFLTVGGEAGVGRGIMSIEKILVNDEDVSEKLKGGCCIFRDEEAKEEAYAGK